MGALTAGAVGVSVSTSTDTSASAAVDSGVISCAQGYIAATGSSECQVQEHPVIVLTMSGSVDAFSERSDRRRSFVAGVAALLQIPERLIVIVSVRSGSIIVELAFVRDAASSASPLDIVSRLKDAAAAGKLQTFGATGFSVGGQAVSLPELSPGITSELSPGIIAGIACGIVFALIVHAFVFVRVQELNVANSKGWVVASVFCGPLVWLLWSLHQRLKVQSNSTAEMKVCAGGCLLLPRLLWASFHPIFSGSEYPSTCGGHYIHFNSDDAY